MPGAKLTSDVVSQLESELLEHKDYWKETTPRANLKFLKEMLGSQGSSHRSGSALGGGGGMEVSHTAARSYTTAHSPSCSPTSMGGARAETATMRRQSSTS